MTNNTVTRHKFEQIVPDSMTVDIVKMEGDVETRGRAFINGFLPHDKLSVSLENGKDLIVDLGQVRPMNSEV